MSDFYWDSQGKLLSRPAWLRYLVHAQVISEREVLVAVPAKVCDGVRSLALTEEVARRELWWDSRRAVDWEGEETKEKGEQSVENS